MEKLSEKEWRPFRVFAQDSDFDIHTTSSSIDGVRLLDGPVKDVPYVTRTDTGNGIARFVSDRNFAFGSDEGGCITAGLDTQTAFYQPHKFVTGQNVQVITGKHIDEETAQFLVPLFKSQMRAKFNWGGNGATLGRMKKLEMMLPVDDDGKPDYAYLASYVNEIGGGC